jgi:predicted dehydrogenase
MDKIRLAVLGAAEVAFKRFLPALKKDRRFAYMGVASRSKEKAAAFAAGFGGAAFPDYLAALESDDVDAVYLPLPPALHFEWGKKALSRGKHVFLEKPSTASHADTSELVGLAREKGLALKENYMFLHHAQMKEIRSVMDSGRIGALRLVRAAFGFPKRSEGDFRYNKELGGGALLDCGGYPLRLASEILGESAKVAAASLTRENPYEVDIAGSATLLNASGLAAQISFGMDNSYKCELELWGSKGCLTATRIFTPQAGFAPQAELLDADGRTIMRMPEDDHFLRSIEHFYDCIADREIRSKSYESLTRQSGLVESVKNLSGFCFES